MDLWDRICTNLGTRKITVKDLSRKSSMDLRLLYGVGYGHPWYGKWDYKFCHGSFGVTELGYSRAIEVLSSLQLDQIVKDFGDAGKCRSKIKQLIRHYRDMNETKLMTLKDLLRFMLTIKSYAPVHINKKATYTASPSSSTSRPRVIANMEDGKWSAKRLGDALEVIVNVLKEKNAENFCHGGMPRQDLRAAARVHIGDTGLLDYVLKLLDNVIVGNHVVRRTKNPMTRIFEYALHELGNGIKASEVLPNPLSEPALEPGLDVYDDLDYLYSNILVDYLGSDLVKKATWEVLNCKYFVKEWPVLIDENGQFLTFTCRLMPLGEIETKMEKGLPLGEVVVVVPLHATVRELKQAVESAAKKTYCIAENFMVTNIEKLEGLNDETFLSEAVASGIDLCVTGIRLALENPLRCQAGIESWKVRCTCGATDYDGERMVACNFCDVMMHTHCCGMKDTQVIPQVYICEGCEVFSSLKEPIYNM
ncbi:PHD finger protein MALE MEIOCYTE DEATH 1-like [Corylus avellana]|uniref:PHD finger protein MALE MEIOCYTE DEATH 1-like n=1 Tax=Corylus avellana TaxID=13451 RepID=UPI00286AB345|nr:PHD finger protein MALE MEIOCYTE DEATH 1-like [Corylus avellana]